MSDNRGFMGDSKALKTLFGFNECVPLSDTDFVSLTNWHCFDKNEKILYGTRVNNGALELRKLNLLCKTEKLIRKMTVEFPPRTPTGYFSQMRIISEFFGPDNCTEIGVIVTLERRGSLPHLYVFFAITLATGIIKPYSFTSESHGFEHDTDGVGAPFSLLYSEVYGWMFRYIDVNECGPYYQMHLNDERKAVYIYQPMTVLGGVVGESVLIDKYVYHFPEDNYENIMHIWNDDDVDWEKVQLSDEGDLINSAAHFSVYQSNIYALPKDFEEYQIFKFDFAKKSWLKIWSSVAKDYDSSETKTIPRYCFISDNIIFVSLYFVEGCHANVDANADVYWDCSLAIAYTKNVMSLQDLCFMQISNRYRWMFDKEPEKEIIDQFPFPATIVRKYFGPDWTRSNENDNCHVSRFVRVDKHVFKLETESE